MSKRSFAEASNLSDDSEEENNISSKMKRSNQTETFEKYDDLTIKRKERTESDDESNSKKLRTEITESGSSAVHKMMVLLIFKINI